MMKGQISLGRVHSNTEDDFIRISIEDDSSGVHFCEVKLSLIDFARLITGLSNIDCDFALRGIKNVGKIRQHKTELLPVVEWNATPDDLAQAVKPFEVDGWIARRDDLKNHHNISGDKVRVSFTRFVEAEQ